VGRLACIKPAKQLSEGGIYSKTLQGIDEVERGENERHSEND